MTDEEALEEVRKMFGTPKGGPAASIWDTPTPEAPPPERPSFFGEFVNGVVQGTSRDWGGFKEALPALAYNMAGNTEEAAKLLAKWDERVKDLDQRYPVTRAREAFESPENFARFVASTLGEAVPTIASIVIPGLGAAKVAAKVAPRLATNVAGKMVPGKVATGIGLGTVGAAQGIPESFATLHEVTGQQAPGTALVAGAIEGALNAIPGFTLLDRLGKEKVMGAALKRAAAEGLFQGAIGAGAGAAGAGVQELAVQFVDANKADFTNIAYGALTGAVQGSALGAGTTVLQRSKRPLPQQEGDPLPTPEQMQADDLDRANAFGEEADRLAGSRVGFVNEREAKRISASEERLQSETRGALVDRFINQDADDVLTGYNKIAESEQSPFNRDVDMSRRWNPAVAQHIAQERTNADTSLPPVKSDPRTLDEVHNAITSTDIGGLGLKPGDLLKPDDIMAATGLKSQGTARAILEEMKKRGLVVMREGRAYMADEPPPPPSDRQLAQERTTNLLKKAREATLGKPKEIIDDEALQRIHQSLLADLKPGEKITERALKHRFPEFDSKSLIQSLRAEAFIGKLDSLFTPNQRETQLILNASRGVKASETSNPIVGEVVNEIAPNLYASDATKDSPVISTVRGIIDKLAPRAKVDFYDTLALDNQDGTLGNLAGVYYKNPGEFHTIAFALGHEDKLVPTAYHEVIHYLKNAELLNKREWEILEREAMKHNWIAEHRIDDREGYKKLPYDARIEESVAEHFRKWRPYLNKLPKSIRPIFEKMDNFFRSLKASLKDTLGMEATTGDIFTKIMQGEIGNRKSVPWDPQRETFARAMPEETIVKQLNAEQLKENEPKSSWINKDTARNLGSLDQMWHTVRGLADKYPTFRRWADGLEIRRQQRTLMRSKYSQRFADIVSNAKDKTNVMRILEAAEYMDQPLLYKGNEVHLMSPADKPLYLSKGGDHLVARGQDAKVLRTLQHAMFDFRNEIAKSILVRLGYDENTNLKTLRESGKEEDKNAASMIGVLYSMPNYFPHMRFGDVAMSVKDKDGKMLDFRTFEMPGKQGTLLRSIARKRADSTMRQERDKLLKKYPGMEVSQPFNLTYDTYKRAMGNPIADLRTAIDMFATGDEEMSAKAFADIEKHLTARNLKHNLLPRENIPGWINDTNVNNYLDQAMNAYVMRGSSFIANNRAHKRLEQGVKDINDSNNADFRNYHDKVMEHISSGREDAQTIRNISFMYYLGFNMSSAMMNGLQTIHTTWPILSVIGGLSGSRHLINGYKLGLRMIKDHQNILQGGNPLEIGKADLTKYFGDDKAKIAAFMEALQDGILAPMQAFEFMGNDQGDFATLAGANKSLARITQLSASLFSSAEIFNRITTWSAFYDAFKKEGALAKADKLLGEQGTWQAMKERSFTPEEAAKYMTNKTQFVMDASNKAMIQRGATMSLITQFMSYNLQMLELWNQMLGSRTGKEGKQVAALMALSMIATSGVWSIPAFGNMKDGLEALWKLITDQGIDIDRVTKEALNEIALYPKFATHMTRGFLPAAMNASTSSRAGAGRIINTQALTGNFDNLLGPSYAMTFGSVKAALDHLHNGHKLLAIGEVLPIAAQNVAKAWEAQERGFRSAQGKTYLTRDQVGATELANQALGFRPESVARVSDLFQAQKNMGNELDSVTSHYHQKIAEAREEIISTNNEDDKAKARRKENLLFNEIRDYNKGKKPADQIKISRSAISERVRQALSSRGPIRGVPTRMREEARSLKPLYGVD